MVVIIVLSVVILAVVFVPVVVVFVCFVLVLFLWYFRPCHIIFRIFGLYFFRIFNLDHFQNLSIHRNCGLQVLYALYGPISEIASLVQYSIV